MADTLIAAHNCAFHSLALSTLGTDSLWGAHLTAYLAAQTLQQAECDYGALALTCDESERERLRAKDTYGPGWQSNPSPLATVERARLAADAAHDKWSKDLCEPFWKATRKLVATPAPTLAAALFKAQVIRLDEVWNDAELSDDCMRIIAEDMARLNAPAPSPDGAILQAWEWRSSATASLKALPLDGDEKGYEKIIDDTDVAIRKHVASTPQGVAVQLWAALDHMMHVGEDNDRVMAGDLEALTDDATLDWDVRLIIAALRSLKSMEA